MELLPSARVAPGARRRWTAAAVLAAVLAGAGLRLVWVRDMEWKADERWTYEQVCRVHAWADLAATGMPASVSIPNPGMSLWVFVGLGKLFAVHSPTDLARAVQVCNAAALLLLVVFAYRFAPPAEREPWLWAAALGAVNPVAVLFQRKIWPPSVLPLLTALLLCAWQRRSTRAGAFLWGLVAVCMGQIHMSGYFLGAGLALWALLFDRRGAAWGAWLAGSAVGALPMVPWLWALAAAPGRLSPPFDGLNALNGKFWACWLEEAFGLGIDGTLRRDFLDFLGYPYVLSLPTYLVAVAHAVLVAVGVALLARLAQSLWAGRRDLGARLVGRGSPSAFLQDAAFWGFGLLLTASCVPLRRHYLIALFPLEFLWVARLALGRRDAPPAVVRRGRAALAVLWAGQFLISACFLGYIHVNPRAHAGYGVPYGAQQPDGRLAGAAPFSPSPLCGGGRGWGATAATTSPPPPPSPARGRGEE